MPEKTTQDKGDSLRDFIKVGAGLTLGAAFVFRHGAWTTMLDGAPAETGQKVRLLSPDGEMIEVDESYLTAASPTKHTKTIRDRVGLENRKFVMVIDLAKCKNARKCVSACQKMHHIPEDKEFIKVLAMKDSDEAPPYWMPKACFHCDNPPCVKVCPVDATYKRLDGLVLIDNERCIGCKFCMAACPYSTRVFNWDEPEVAQEDISQCGHKADHVNNSAETSRPARLGTVAKCDFCPDMSRIGKLPDCVTACPNGVIYFGDENEDVVTNGTETVRFSELIKEKAGYRYMEELGTQPRLYYLPPTDRIFPFERGLEDKSEDLLKSYDEVLQPEKSKTWLK
jgi:molybdopterin-containing oxidoreductase family iron-sulfur binding subunit